jgi:hypothetical protein
VDRILDRDSRSDDLDVLDVAERALKALEEHLLILDEENVNLPGSAHNWVRITLTSSRSECRPSGSKAEKPTKVPIRTSLIETTLALA